jgi:hypothetical protein
MWKQRLLSAGIASLDFVESRRWIGLIYTVDETDTGLAGCPGALDNQVPNLLYCVTIIGSLTFQEQVVYAVGIGVH